MILKELNSARATLQNSEWEESALHYSLRAAAQARVWFWRRWGFRFDPDIEK